MKVIVSIEIPLAELPDDVGSIDNWVSRYIQEASEEAKSTETGLIQELIPLTWKVVDS